MAVVYVNSLNEDPGWRGTAAMSICPPGTFDPALPTYASTSPEPGEMTTAAPSVTCSLPSCAICALTACCVNCCSAKSSVETILRPAVVASRCQVVRTLLATRATKKGTRLTLSGFEVT